MRRRPQAVALLTLSVFSVYLYLLFFRYSSTDSPGFQLSHGGRRKQSLIHEWPPPNAVGKLVPTSTAQPDSVLLADWEVLLLLPYSSPRNCQSRGKVCVFQNGDTSPARCRGTLLPSNRTSFSCKIPRSARRQLPFLQPVLVPENETNVEFPADRPELPRGSFLVYDALTTETDVVVFAKGLNGRQGVNLAAEDLRCVFSASGNPAEIYTDVTSSVQEVFRCLHPDPIFNSNAVPIKVSLQIHGRVIPSVAYYRPRSPPPEKIPTYELCACTMVFNVGKFLKEWIMYHSYLGVEKFILYDNWSEDQTEAVVEEELKEYDITHVVWPWPKTQEAGFSHAVAGLLTRRQFTCKWVLFIDVDEFFFSPTWVNLTTPKGALIGLVNGPNLTHIGQIQTQCLEFGPSGQRSHPKEGVTQGYDCRRKVEQRHKSIVLIEAVGPSLLNLVHHFELRDVFESRVLDKDEGVINHYKYQAWSEFKAKFRRRVSAYVVDWRQARNLGSRDRTPGLGYEPIEPKGWAQKFCEVRDGRLKELARRWFGLETPGGHKMLWED